MSPQNSTLKGLNFFFKFVMWGVGWGRCSGICMQDCNCLQHEMSFRRRLQTEISVFVFKTDITKNSSLNSSAWNPSQQFLNHWELADTPTSVFILSQPDSCWVFTHLSTISHCISADNELKSEVFSCLFSKQNKMRDFSTRNFYVPLQSKKDRCTGIDNNKSHIISPCNIYIY